MIKLVIVGTVAAAALAAVPAWAQRVPPGHRPPPGECRVWYPDRPPGHQPPPTDCRSARAEARHYGGRVVRGDRYDGDWGDRRRREEARRWDEDEYVRVCVERDWYGRCVRTELHRRW